MTRRSFFVDPGPLRSNNLRMEVELAHILIGDIKHAVDTENAVLRNRLKDIKAASMDLVEAVEKYLRQGCLRSELIIKKDNLKKH